MMADEGQIRTRERSQANQLALIVRKRKQLRSLGVRTSRRGIGIPPDWSIDNGDLREPQAPRTLPLQMSSRPILENLS